MTKETARELGKLLSEAERAQRRLCFEKSRHCLALEGMIVTPEELAEQERVITGEWTYDELVEHGFKVAHEEAVRRQTGEADQ
jgi:hypothetical protein